MRVGAYWHLLSENEFKIHPTRWPMTALSAGCAVVNSTLSGVQSLAFNKKIKATELVAPPIFVIGHWRSGTTLLHELMSLDPKLAFPTTYDAFVPGHSVISRWMFMPFMKLLMPSKRPMDNMSFSASSPQEDDFALLSLNAPTPYRKIAFPNGALQDQWKLDPKNLSAGEIEEIKIQLSYFYKTLTVQYGKRLVVKSPPHTGRIKLLAEMFPGAKFVHIARHPHKLVPSTCRLWRSLYHLQAFQVTNLDDDQLIDYVCECKALMYNAYFRDRNCLSDGQLIEVRFEDFIANPVAGLKQVYQHLEIDGLEDILPLAKAYLQKRSGHKTAPYPQDNALNSRIDREWKQYMDAFGYD